MRSTTTAGLVLLLFTLALATLFSPGCKSAPKSFGAQRAEKIAELRSRVASSVKDPARRAEMLEVVDRFDADTGALVKSCQVARDEYAEIVATHAADQQRFDAAWAQFTAKVAPLRERIIDERLRLAELSTDAEWSGIAERFFDALQLVMSAIPLQVSPA